MKTPFACLALLPCVGIAMAQGPVQSLPLRGMMPSMPTGFVMLTEPTQIVMKQAGLPVNMTPFPNVGNGVALFDAAQLERVLVMSGLSGASFSSLEFDAMSSENDLLPLIHQAGMFRISQGSVSGWAALYLALEDNSGTPIGVHGYYFDNPSFPAQLRNGIYTELEATELDPSGRKGPVAMDVSMGLLVDNVGRMMPGMLEVKNRLYFSLTDRSAEALWNELAAPRLTRVDESAYTPPAASGRYTGATIFVAEFDSTGVCVDVDIAEDHESLGLYSETEIDALAIGATQTPLPYDPLTQQTLTANTLQIAFSTEPAWNGDELMVVAYVDVVQGSSIVSMRTQDPLRDNQGNQLVVGGGSIGRRVRAMCSQDPENNFGAAAYGVPEDYQDTAGNPVSTPLMGLSLAARYIDNATDRFALTGVLSGWVGTPQVSVYQVVLEVASGPLAGYRHSFPWRIRLATEDAVSFVEKIDIPWLSIGSAPNYTPFKSQYRFWVVQGGSQSQQVTESIRLRLFREM